ncbi:MAG: hypothetical protein WCA31_00785 [Acidimicrobiales bacterium]
MSIVRRPPSLRAAEIDLFQFGLVGRGHFRVSFSQDADRLAQACDAIEEVVRAP